MSIAYLTDEEARTLTKEKEGLLVRLVKPQPELILPYNEWVWKQSEHYYIKLSDIGEYCHYGHPGEVLHCKETWKPHSAVIKTIQYRDGIVKSFSLDANAYTYDYNFKWHSPVTMPPEFIRLKPVIQSIEVKRVQDITEHEAALAGDPKQGLIASENTHKEWFKDSFNRHNKGQYSYESNCWCWFIGVKETEG